MAISREPIEDRGTYHRSVGVKTTGRNVLKHSEKGMKNKKQKVIKISEKNLENFIVLGRVMGESVFLL